jgi:hypothetical protein
VVRGFFNQITSAALPTLTAFASALVDSATSTDSLSKAAKDLNKDGSLTNWAESAGSILSFVMDAGMGVSRVIEGVGKTLAAMAAQAVMIAKLDFKGASQVGFAWLDDMRDLLDREMFSTRFEKKLAELKAKLAQAGKAGDGGRGTLGSPGGNGEEKISDYEKLIRTIKEKIAADEAEIAANDKLSEAEKIRTKMMSDLASGQVKMTAAEVSKVQAELFLLEVTGQLNDARKSSVEWYAKQAEAAKKAVTDAEAEAKKNEDLVATLGMTKTQIELLELSRLEAQRTQAKTNELTEEEIKNLDKLIAAKRRNVHALSQIEMFNDEAERAKKSAEEMSEFSKQGARNMQDAMSQGFFDIMDGNFKSMGEAFKRTLQKMAADALAANINNAIFGKGFGATGEFGAGSLLKIGMNLLGISTGTGAAGPGLLPGATGGMDMNDSPMSWLLDPPKALGGDVQPYSLQEVNERGPELLSVGGRDYLMMGNQGGTVTPNHALGKSVSVTYAPVIQIDSRTDQAEVHKIVSRAVQQGNAQLVDRLQRSGAI